MVPLGELVIITLTELLTSSSQNAGVFRHHSHIYNLLVLPEKTSFPRIAFLSASVNW
jgi:hypothetical protein